MDLTENISLSSAAFPITEFKEHLRLSTGFGDDDIQDNMLETCLSAAMGAIESHTSKMLIMRSFNWELRAWRLEEGAQTFPVAPVKGLLKIILYQRDGSSEVLTLGDYAFVKDSQRPLLVSKAGSLPQIPELGSVLVKFFAGYGDWSDVPAPLQQAMLMLATMYYENRDSMISASRQMPMGVLALIEPYRRLRLGGPL